MIDIEKLHLSSQTSEIATTGIQVDQIKAADSVLSAIQDLKNKRIFPPNLEAVEETDVYRLRRGLCLPAASATCINQVLGFRLIGDENGYLTLGDIYTTLLPFHGNTSTNETQQLPKGWLVSTDQGDIYHHAIVTFAKALGVNAKAVGGFSSIQEFDSDIIAGNALAISLDNNFVLEQTLASKPQLMKVDGDQKFVLIDSGSGLDYRRFENGRHVVAVTSKTDDYYILHDSFRLPQMDLKDTELKLSAETVNHYLKYKQGGSPRGILFSKREREIKNSSRIIDVIEPREIVENIHNFISAKLTGFSSGTNTAISSTLVA